MRLWQFVLFLHILLVIVGFGPTFAFGLIAARGAKEPAHANFALRVTEMTEKRLVIPLAVITPFLGLWLILLRDWDLWGSEWLIISIAIYIVAFSFAVLVLAPTAGKLVRLTMSAPAAGAQTSAPSGPQGPGADAPKGPPPEVARLAKIMQFGGIFESFAIAAIVLLMVWKPGAAFITP